MGTEAWVALFTTLGSVLAGVVGYILRRINRLETDAEKRTEDEIAERDTKISERDTQIAGLETRIVLLEAEAALSKERGAQLEELRKQVTLLSEKADGLQKKVDDLTNQLGDKTQELERLISEKRALEKELADTQARCHDLETVGKHNLQIITLFAKTYNEAQAQQPETKEVSAVEPAEENKV